MCPEGMRRGNLLPELGNWTDRVVIFRNNWPNSTLINAEVSGNLARRPVLRDCLFVPKYKPAPVGKMAVFHQHLVTLPVIIIILHLLLTFSRCVDLELAHPSDERWPTLWAPMQWSRFSLTFPDFPAKESLKRGEIYILHDTIAPGWYSGALFLFQIFVRCVLLSFSSGFSIGFLPSPSPRPPEF